MKQIFIQVKDIFWIEKLINKKIYINGKQVSVFKKDYIKIETQESDSFSLKLSLLGDFFSGECVIPKSDKPIVVIFNSRFYPVIQYIIVLLSCFVVIDIIWLKWITVLPLMFLFWGTLSAAIIYIMINRKKRYSIKTHHLGMF